jgi:peroxiredoxin-like protein
MKPLPHRYEVRITAGPTGYGTLTDDGVPPLATATPVQYDGPGDAWSPEQLLLASIASCFAMTFRAGAQVSKIAFESLALQIEGSVDKVDGRVRFTEIVLRPKVALPAGADVAKVRRALEKAEHNCLVSASLATPVRLEVDIVG